MADLDQALKASQRSEAMASREAPSRGNWSSRHGRSEHGDVTDRLFAAATACDTRQPLRHAQTVTLRRAARRWSSGGTLPSVTVAYETYGKLNAARRQRRAHLPRPQRRLARRPRTTPRTTPAGGTSSSGPGKADRHRQVLRHLPERPGRLPRHDRARQRQPGHGQAVRPRLPDDHHRRHGRGAAAAGRAPGHRRSCWRSSAARWAATRCWRGRRGIRERVRGRDRRWRPRRG